MQGTIVMLMALTGVGCHNKGCNDCDYGAPYMGGCYSSAYDVGYASYGPGCYGTTSYDAYNGVGYNSCYGGGGYYGGDACYGGGCYGGGCYGGGGGHGHRGLFACMKRKRCGICNPAPVCAPVAYGGCYGGGYSETASFGSYTPVYGGMSPQMPMLSSQGSYQSAPMQGVPTKQGGMMGVPSKQGGYAPSMQGGGTSEQPTSAYYDESMGDTMPDAPTTPPVDTYDTAPADEAVPPPTTLPPTNPAGEEVAPGL